MHGIVFAELQKFVSTNYGEAAWDQLRQNAGVAGKMYLPVQEYPDSEIKALVTTAAQMTGRPVPAILEDFGAFIVPSLARCMGTYFRRRGRPWT